MKDPARMEEHDHEDHHECGHRRRGRGRGGRGRSEHRGHGRGRKGFAGKRPGSGEGMFNVKRPLRFLIHKLDLDDDQAMVVADAFSDFRIEKAQAEVDRSRAKKLMVQAMSADEFDLDQAQSAVKAQVETSQQLHEAFLAAIQRIHAVLKPDQRTRFVFLIGSLDLDL